MFLQLLAAYVARDAGDSSDLAILITHRRTGDGDGDDGPVAMASNALLILHLAARDYVPSDLFPFHIFRRRQRGHALADHLAFNVAEHLGCTWIPGQQRAVHRPAHDRVIGRADDCGEQAQLLLLRFLLGDVATDAAIAFEAGVSVEDRLTADGQVILAAARIARAIFEILERFALRQRLRVLGALLFRLPRDRQLEACAAQDRAPNLILYPAPLGGVISEAQLFVLLPAPVIGEGRQRMQPRMALCELALGLLVHADVADDARHAD